MKIVFLDTATIGLVPELHDIEALGKTTFFEKTSSEQIIGRCKDAEIVITNKVVFRKEVLAQLPKLRLICIAATGMNNVDLDYAATNDIQVKNVSGYSTDSVAQVTFSLMLNLFSHISFYDFYAKNEYASSELFTYHGKTITELKGKTIGIIGLGNIGKQVAKIAAAFGMDIIYYSTSGENHNDDYAEVSLSELLFQADIVSIHAPLNAETTNLISSAELEKMKPAAILINVGRGGIVDETALAKAVDADIIAGAGVDVFTQEPLSKDNPLLHVRNRDKIILLPHVAWASLEARTTLMEGVINNIKSFQNA